MHYDRHLALGLLVLGAVACTRDDATAELDTNSPEAVEARCAGPLAPVVTAGGIGPVRLGSRPSEIAERCPVRDTTLVVAGMSGPAVMIRVAGSSVIAQAGSDSTITRIIVLDSAYQTERGVGVGSTVGDLRLAHGRICALRGEGEIIVAAQQMPGISFATSVAAGAIPDVESDAAAMPDSAHITRLWVFDGEAACAGK